MKSTDRMHLTKSELIQLHDKVNSDPILLNAFRLFEDGDLLFANKRHASVVALSVLSMEEIGKHLLNLWAAADPSFKFDKRKYHQSKQAAIAALYMTNSARKEVVARMRSSTSDLSKMKPAAAVAEIVTAIQRGLDKESAFASAVKGGAINTVKFSGLYFDPDLSDKGIGPDKIDEKAARELMESCSKAFMLIVDDGNIEIARIVYDLIYPPAKESPSS